MQEQLGGLQGVEFIVGPDAAETLARDTEADMVLNALVGSAGLGPTLAALQAGKTLALANKESLVVGGELVIDLVKGEPERLVPVDSEHAALAHCLRGERREDLKRVVITGSGGPFRGWTRAELAQGLREGGPRAPRVEDGPEDHDRLGHADEQGSRGDRGALPVRPRVLADPRRCPPRGRRPRDGGVPRRQLEGGVGDRRHAAADPARARLARAPADRRGPGPAHRAAASASNRSTAKPSPRSTSHTASAVWGSRSRRS